MLLARDQPGDRARARALASEAVALYHALGMPAFAKQTQALLG
jgi:hypothetical protein